MSEWMNVAGVAHQPNSLSPRRSQPSVYQGGPGQGGGGAPARERPRPHHGHRWGRSLSRPLVQGVRGGTGAGLKGPESMHPHRPNQFSETQLPESAAPPEARALEPSPEALGMGGGSRCQGESHRV
uniref:Uncharacterized protein n=1 Tax=Myotis myotis TaxID=51298 RepID=A0A7J7ZX78_MYOMY|nr:hypothetical protein mMyoMyo1_009647 [Myotis myotis]